MARVGGWTDAVLARMGAGGLVVTSNERTARSFRREFDRRKRALGEEVWEPAQVLSWESWTGSMWRGLLLDGHVTGMLLNRSQELLVWRGVIREDALSGASEGEHGQLAQLAAEAWALSGAYGGTGRLRSYGGNADTAAFGRWTEGFRRRCREGGYVSRAGIEAELRTEVQAGRMRLPEGRRLELVGFDELLPARRGLVEALREGGVEVTVRPEGSAAGERLLLAVENDAEELRSCAMWIRTELERRPEMRLGVIVSELGERREAIDRSFRRVLAPELESLEASADAGGPYEFSLGVALGRTPAGLAAIGLLRWATEALPAERVSGLLLSPYVGGAEMAGEREARAALDAFGLRQRSTLQPEMGAEEALRLIRGSRWARRVPGLLRAMSGFVAEGEACRGGATATYGEWAEVMAKLLDAVRWREGGGGGKVAFGLLRRWEGALDELATLDFAGERVGYREALGELERIARETIFASESRGAAVGVMGPDEAAGSDFDAVWLMGAGDAGWPPRPRVHPLLPWAMQRELGMPGAEVGLDAARGRAVTERIAGSAPVAVFSYPRHTGEGVQRASAVLEGMGFEAVEAATLVGETSEVEPVQMERFEDAEPVDPLPDRVIRGGAAVLEAQAACGFRAFAERRLGGSVPETKGLGWDARRRGEVVHRALELFWGEVRSQEALLAMTDGERGESLRRAIDGALRGRQGGEGATVVEGWDGAYLSVQREWLQRLLGEWMEVEKRRDPFAVKLSEKALNDVRVGPLRLDVRVDRVDETEFGEVLIDYKTGAVTPGGWEGSRPDQPQLPLYAILSETRRIEGVAFGSVRAGKDMRLAGYAEHVETLGSKPARHDFKNLGEQVEVWREVLTGLAEEFHRGDARVNPKSYPNTCKYCKARILCRLDAAALEMGAEEEEDGDEEAGESERG